MAKIRITRPQSTGTRLYGSLREHHHFVALSIELGNAGDHLEQELRGAEPDDLGFKGAAPSRIVKRVPKYRHRLNRDPEFMGMVDAPAPELEGKSSTIVEVWLSFEQFSELLTSTGHAVDCTLHDYRCVGETGAHYGERIERPRSIYERWTERLKREEDRAAAEIQALRDEVMELKISNKAKRALMSRIRQLELAAASSIAFLTKQAVEEMSQAAEAATTIIADKVGALEQEGKLPPGATEHFLHGSDFRALPHGETEE